MFRQLILPTSGRTWKPGYQNKSPSSSHSLLRLLPSPFLPLPIPHRDAECNVELEGAARSAPLGQVLFITLVYNLRLQVLKLKALEQM